MTTFRKSGRHRLAIFLAFFALTVVLLAVAYHFAGYEPTDVISLTGVYPLTVQANGVTLIAGTTGEGHNELFPHVVGPIRFLDLATGREIQPSLPLRENAESGWTTISETKLAANDKLLVVVQTATPERYILTIFDLVARVAIFEKVIPFAANSQLKPAVQFAHDGHLLAFERTDDGKRSVTVWDLETRQERFHLPGRISPQFSPDGLLLATREIAIPEQFQLSDTNTGQLIHSVGISASDVVGFSVFKETPTFSPDGIFVATDNSQGRIQVLDVASGNLAFETNGWSPQFLPGGSLLGVRNSGRPMQVDSREQVPEIVVWSSDGWPEMRAFPYDFGRSILSGTVLPHPWPTGRANEFGLIYETAGGWWTGSAKSSGTASSGLGRSLKLNVPRGLGLDVVDPATGITRTYNLDGSMLWYPFPQADKILIPQSGDTADVWDIPPRRSYAAVWAMAGIMAVIGVLAYALVLVVRVVARRYRGRQQSA